MSETRPLDTPSVLPPDVPRGDWAGFRQHWAADVVSGFLVFLIALPLCLGIALASGFPPVAGVFTAIVGGLIAPFLSNAEMAIKGPAAGLIVIVIGAVTDFGGTGFADGEWSALDQEAYRATLGVGVVAAVAQVLFGLARGGVLGDFFPSAAVHGMLAAIGIIILSKQIPVALGVSAKGSPIELLFALPRELADANPEIALIGGTSLLLLVGWTFVTNPVLRRIPGQVVVLVVSIPLAYFLGLDDPAPHRYEAFGHTYEVSQKYLVNVPASLFSSLASPTFDRAFSKTGLYWATLFMLIGTLESLLSAKAIELLDPHHRRTNLDGDNTAVGVGNLLASFVGGLPMISEIVRSRANIDSGAKTRFSNFFHGVFLLAFLVLVPGLLRTIPLAALAAMLVFTGFRLAHPREFAKVKKIGNEQLVVFVGTTVAVLLTDLLEGIAIGVALELLVLVFLGVPFGAIFRPRLRKEEVDGGVVLHLEAAAVFSNWIALRRYIEESCSEGTLTLNLEKLRLVDHTVMTKLHQLRAEVGKRGTELVFEGLEQLSPMSDHPHSARRSLRPRSAPEGAGTDVVPPSDRPL